MEVDEDVTGRNKVYGFVVSDEERSHNPSLDPITGFSNKEGLRSPGPGLEGEAGTAKTYELQALLAADPE
jgi:hypothetical protein